MDFSQFKESPKIIKRQFTFFVTAYIMVMSKSVCVRFDAMFDTHINTFWVSSAITVNSLLCHIMTYDGCQMEGVTTAILVSNEAYGPS